MPLLPFSSNPTLSKVGSAVIDGTSGSVLFVDSNGNLAQDNSNFFWDNTEKRLGIGTDSPEQAIHISDGDLKVERTGGPAVIIANRTDGEVGGLSVGMTRVGFRYPDDGIFAIQTQDRTEIIAGSGGFVRNVVQIQAASISNAIFVDTSGRVAMNTDSPDTNSQLTVYDDRSAGTMLTLEQESASRPVNIKMVNKAEGYEWIPGVTTDGKFKIRDGLAGNNIVLIEEAAPANSLYIDSDGLMGVGTQSPSSLLESAKSFAAQIETVTENTTLSEDHHTVLVDATTAETTITLPTATSSTRRIYHIKKIDSSTNSVIVDGDSTETIDGETTKTINSQYGAIAIQSDGSEWHVLG